MNITRDERLAGADAVWLQDTPANLMVINSVISVDRMDLETLRQLWQERVMEAGDGARYPRFRKRVVCRGRGFYWQEDSEFELGRHIIEAPEAPTGSRALADREALEAHVGRLASTPLPGDRPLWQLQLIPEFGDGGSAVISRIHHCMGDGIALVPILFSMMDASPEGGGQVFPSVVDKGGKAPHPWALAAHATLAGPWLLLRKMLWRADRSSLHGPSLSGEKQVAWTDAFEVAKVKEVKNAFGATVNDVLVACVAGAFARYAERHPGERLGSLRVSMPVNVRSRSEQLEMNNKFAAVLLPLPVGIRDIRQRVQVTKERMDALKRSIEPVFTYGIVRLMLEVLPASWSRALINYLANKCTCVLSNVPGPQTPVYMAGRRLRGMLFWVPQRADIGIGVSILSFDGGLRVGVIADTALIADPADLVRAFEDELEDLHRAAEHAFTKP